MQIDVELKGLDGLLDALKKLPPEVVSKNGGPVRVALRKAAQVIVKQAKANFGAAVAMAGVSGITDTTGFTQSQIRAKRGRRMPAGVKGERQLVTVRYELHPSGNTFRNRPIRANDIAFLMEHGSSKQPATPWLKPAFETKAPEALATIERELPRAIARAARKLGFKTEGA